MKLVLIVVYPKMSLTPIWMCLLIVGLGNVVFGISRDKEVSPILTKVLLIRLLKEMANDTRQTQSAPRRLYTDKLIYMHDIQDVVQNDDSDEVMKKSTPDHMIFFSRNMIPLQTRLAQFGSMLLPSNYESNHGSGVPRYG
ncbi:hypothetical protein CHS0354_020392 [Potamilus streckersoni]|uniref:Uncharacterized protein n=1 Tax=Potamilus streckersoni TaxID=2493646 RepID=A0AAE0TFK3_9BIVA|nr:hypothetical protein CHS0354_020392 [Potamilus streckersoni]